METTVEGEQQLYSQNTLLFHTDPLDQYPQITKLALAYVCVPETPVLSEGSTVRALVVRTQLSPQVFIVWING